jgi:hypothetical protein
MGRFLKAVPALLLLSWLSIIALQNLRADAPLRDANREIQAWAAGGLTPSAETWDAIYTQLRRCARLSRNNPVVFELMGHMASRRTDSAEYMHEASVHFARALELRPASPYTWANLAEAQYRRGDANSLFEVAIRNATQLGPAEPGVQRLVANYGLAAWDEVSETTRKSIDQMVGAGVRRWAPEMLQIAGRRGRLQTACRHLEGITRTPDAKWLQLCQSTEATS